MRSTPPPGETLARQGWISLALWITFGLLLEGFIGFRTPALLDDSVRRELFRLAHAHGTLLSIVLIVAALCARLKLIRLARMGALGLRAAALVFLVDFCLVACGISQTIPESALFSCH